VDPSARADRPDHQPDRKTPCPRTPCPAWPTAVNDELQDIANDRAASLTWRTTARDELARRAAQSRRNHLQAQEIERAGAGRPLYSGDWLFQGDRVRVTPTEGGGADWLALVLQDEVILGSDALVYLLPESRAVGGPRHVQAGRLTLIRRAEERDIAVAAALIDAQPDRKRAASFRRARQERDRARRERDRDAKGP
jgi:hypothetical protein